MSIALEQDKEQTKLAFALQSRADIRSVRLVDARASCKIPFEQATPPLAFHLSHQAENAAVEGSKLSIPIKFGFKAVSTDGDVNVIIIMCRLQVDYELMEGYHPSAEEIDAFKKGNAIFNCWTYFREFVQSSVTRMNYPPPVLPFLRLAPRATTVDRAESKAITVPRKPDAPD